MLIKSGTKHFPIPNAHTYLRLSSSFGRWYLNWAVLAFSKYINPPLNSCKRNNDFKSMYYLGCHLIRVTTNLHSIYTNHPLTYARYNRKHYSDVIMGAMASRITSPRIVYSTVYSGANKRKPQRSTSLTSVRGIHRWPVNSPHKWPVTRKMLPFDDIFMNICIENKIPNCFVSLTITIVTKKL